MPPFSPSEKCSKHFTYADFINCGETQKAVQVENIPKDPRTFAAIRELSSSILDPVVEQYGEIILTYGFCSNELLQHIQKRPHPGIAPQLDQHSGYEVNSRSNPICKRPGFACDFYSKQFDSLTIAKWIVQNLEFDRLYFYGKNRPLHISIGPENHSAITLLEKSPSGRRIPKNIKKETFLLK